MNASIKSREGVDLSNVESTVAEHGWASYSIGDADIVGIGNELRRVSDRFGTRAHGRGGATLEIIQPLEESKAHPRSLSAQVGLDAIPFHSELSHRLRPCRYIALGCVNPGSPGVETTMLDWRELRFSLEELTILEGAPVLVRSGRGSFYTTLLPSNREFLRCDSCCLEAVDERGRNALQLLHERVATGRVRTHSWRSGDVLIIDNWRILHGRESSTRSAGRKLVRVVINA